ncbi:hypothetical protein Hypma_016188 [Hypsizygus marmoreus]|uniref:F-box domain-containing protein n=1 Tax=Hypsizygus marmoreus TaxID=39966 RepID=A0A369IYZ7_HYPMA|nr:hypothetical protein Hypma_016188 [Hypsizygus marmoreus]
MAKPNYVTGSSGNSGHFADLSGELSGSQVLQAARSITTSSPISTLLISLSQHQLSSVVECLDSGPTLPSKKQTGILKDAISSNEQAIMNLRTLIRGLKAETKHYRSLLSPIRILPNELLLEVFRLLMPNEDVPPHAHSAPLVLCHVCASWRTLVLSIPEFWSRLTFPMPFKYFEDEFSNDEHPNVDKEADRHASLLRFWFGNAGSRLLTFVLCTREKSEMLSEYDTFPMEWDLSYVWDSIIEALSEHLDCIQNLVFSLDSIWEVRSFLILPDLALPRLTSLVFRNARNAQAHTQWDYWAESDDHEEAWPAFRNAPRLCSTTLECYDGMHLYLQLPYTQLIEMDWGNTMIKVDEFRDNLDICPALRKGIFLIGGLEYDYIPLSDNIHLQLCSSVVDLTVEFGNSSLDNPPPASDSHAFDELTFLAIQRLVLASVGGTALFPWVGESHDLSKQISLHLLHSLTLARIHISTDELLAVLKLTSNLTDLSIGLAIDHDRLFDFLTDVALSYPPRFQLANLRRLAFVAPGLGTVDGFFGVPFTPSTFFYMVESRSVPPEICIPLESVHLFVRRPWSGWMDASLGPFLSQLSPPGGKSKIRFQTTVVDDAFEFRDHSSTYEFHDEE